MSASCKLIKCSRSSLREDVTGYIFTLKLQICPGLLNFSIFSLVRKSLVITLNINPKPHSCVLKKSSGKFRSDILMMMLEELFCSIRFEVVTVICSIFSSGGRRAVNSPNSSKNSMQKISFSFGLNRPACATFV